MAMRIWNKTVYSSAHLTRPLLKPHREIFAWCVKSVIVNKMLVFCCCFIYIYMYMYLCVYIYYIALAHPVSFAALSPLPDPLVKKQHKNRLVFAYITQFSQLQSDANCPDESILKQSKQNWARLWSTIKRPLNICISEHAPANDSLPPHPTPTQPSLHSTSICLQRHHSTEKARKINGLLLPVQTKGLSSSQQSILHCDIQQRQVLCRSVNMRFALFVLNPCLAACFGHLLSHTDEQMIHSRGFNVTVYEVAPLLEVNLKMFGPWAIDHSEGKMFFSLTVESIVMSANWQIEHYTAARLSHINAGTRTNSSVNSASYSRRASSHFRPATWFQYLIWPSNGSNMTITHLEQPACQKPLQLMTGDGG